MEAIVHIGLPKTGSTAIQTYLAAHARGLSERGIHYETGSWLGDTNHFKLPLAVLRSAGLQLDAQSAAIASWLGRPEDLPAHGAQALAGVEKIAELSDIRQVIFSTEFLSFWLQTPREFAALHDLMTRLFSSVRYIVYFRAPVGHAESDYNQHIKTGMTDDLATFARSYPEKIA